jgi:hypothetical protein
MPACPSCGQDLPVPTENVTDSFPCVQCGKQLQAALKCRNLFLAVGAAFALVLRVATLFLNPRTNSRKTAQLPLVLEDFLIRTFWKTKLIKIVTHQPNNATAKSEPSAGMT